MLPWPAVDVRFEPEKRRIRGRNGDRMNVIGDDESAAPDPLVVLQAVNVQLAEIQRQLLETPNDDFATRNALRRAQDDLRAEAAAVRESRPLSKDERDRLEQRLAMLRRRREELFGGRVTARQTASSTAWQTQGGSMNGAALAAIDQAILAAGGLDELRHEIAVLEQRLASDGPSRRVVRARPTGRSE